MFNNNFKFRAWDKLNKKLIYPCSKFNDTFLVFSETGWFIVDHISGKHETILISENGTLTQSTGQFTKDNKEIYIGDISREVIEYDDGDETEYYVCCWIKEWCRFAWLNTVGEYDEYLENGIENLDEDTTTFGVFNYDLDKLNICGNIFENPEKLKL